MASTSSPSVPHSILKTSQNHDESKHQHSKKPEHASFDEMNIMATYHPADKDYGHMKIDEPKTPYRKEDSDSEAVSPNALAERLGDTSGDLPKRNRTISTDDEDDDENLTPEARARKQKFREARKQHYNMKEEMRRAKELLAVEMQDMEEN